MENQEKNADNARPKQCAQGSATKYCRRTELPPASIRPVFLSSNSFCAAYATPRRRRRYFRSEGKVHFVNSGEKIHNLGTIHL